MSDYEAVIGVKVVNYLESFKDDYQENDYTEYFMESGEFEACFEMCYKLLSLFQRVDEKNILGAAHNAALTCSTYNLPYIVLQNFLERFKNTILCNVLEEGHSASIAYHLLKQMNIALDTISKYYLSIKIEEFLKHNKHRIDTIKKMMDTKAIYFFEGHLFWLNKLAQSISDLDVNTLPELSPTACILGQWLHNEGKQIIVDQERWQHLNTSHHHLHHVAKRVEVLLQSTPIDYHYLLLLLDKADHLALSIGVDLSLISNIEYIESSSKDPLTGVLNRQLLEKIFQTQFELSKSLDCGFALIMGDIDDFKKVNDQHGHVFGDFVLKEFAHVLINSVRKSDFVIRYGGEEFMLILPVTTMDEAESIANTICNTFSAKPIKRDNDSLSISASFGVSYIHPEMDEPSSKKHMLELIDEVDQKLLLAKQLGKNKVVA